MQSLYQHRTLVQIDYRLTCRRAKADLQLPVLGIPAHRNARPAPIAQLRAEQRWCPLLRLQRSQTAQLLGQAALFQGNLLGMRQVLQGAAATAPGQRTGRRAPQDTGLEHPLDPRIHHLATGGQHPRLDLFASQRAGDEPGAPALMGDAAPVVGQTLDDETLLLADRQLYGARTAARLEAQPGVAFGHQATCK